MTQNDPETTDTNEDSATSENPQPNDDANNLPQDSAFQSELDTVAETRDEELERLRDETDQAKKGVLLAQAEAENFRKRMRRDLEDQMRFAALPLVEDILVVRENLLRALAAAENTTDSAGLQEGVAMVSKQLDDALAKHSVEEIAAQGEAFDPNLHEAISQMPSEEKPEGAILHVTQSGFRMHDRVIRPTQVVVSSGSAGT